MLRYNKVSLKKKLMGKNISQGYSVKSTCTGEQKNKYLQKENICNVLNSLNSYQTCYNQAKKETHIFP